MHMVRDFTRRDLLRLSGGALLSLGLWPGRLRANNSTADDATFLAVNDLHFRDADCAPWFEEAVAAMKASAPQAEFCLLAGDLAEDGALDQLAGVRDAFRGLRIPVYCAIGNHDYSGDKDRRSYEEAFPGQINYAFEHRGWQFVGLDTTVGLAWKDTTISSTTLNWLNENLPKLDKRKPVVLFTHFPLGAGVPMRPLNADELLDRFLEFNLSAVLCGHYHGLTERWFGKTTITTDRCCSRIRGNHDGSKEKGWFICKARGSGDVTRQFVAFEPSTSLPGSGGMREETGASNS